jgi:hypothetical protein
VVWRERVESVDPKAAFSSPASREQLDEAEAALGSKLPEDLRGLLVETDGVEGEGGLGVVWPLDRIVGDNIRFRASYGESYMPFDSLLFFADAGNGDQFAFPMTAAHSSRDEVFVWDHEDDSRRWFAASLNDYIRGWLSGELKL